jgi:hypothetical protein
MMKVGDVVFGYGDQDGIYLHSISTIEDETVSLEITLYSPEDPLFSWALEQLNGLEQ